MNYQIINGNNIDVLKTFPDNHFDSIVTDPPYGIDFLGKTWDANTGALETYQECLRVLKPGGHILAFSAARTYHHLAITLEQAGFEIRDQIMWIYSSGFPKSQDVGKSIDRTAKKGKFIKTGKTKVSGGPKENPIGPLPRSEETIYIPETDEAKQWAGWGTALKPAHEPICMARKPIKLSIAKNAQKWGVGALNIDATRVPYEDPKEAEADAKWRAKYSHNNTGAPTFQGTDKPKAGQRTASFHNATGGGETQAGGDGSGGWTASNIGRFPSNVLGEIVEPYQKYFYCPKVSRKERHAGFDEQIKNWEIVKAMGGHYITAEGEPILEDGDFGNQAVIPGYGWITLNGIKSIYEDWCKKNNVVTDHGNNHPTVKPIELMKYLIKLVTPLGGIVLDPFNGSGSTGCAAVELGCEYVGIELDPKYVDIARKRIEAWNKEETAFNDLFE